MNRRSNRSGVSVGVAAIVSLALGALAGGLYYRFELQRIVETRLIAGEPAARAVSAEGRVLLAVPSERSALRSAWMAFGGLACALFLAYLFFDRCAHARVAEAQREADFDRVLLAQAIEQAAESVVVTDARGKIEYVNPAFSKVSGYSRAEALGANPRFLKSGKHDQAFYAELWAVLGRHETWKGHLVNRRKDGTFYEEEASISPVCDTNGGVTHYIAVKRDVSKEHSLEDQLRQSQKMEAVGRLAGGVAHDFNNILTSILGYAEIAAQSAPPGSELAQDIGEITRAGKLAASLTRQLLTFSRKQVVDPTTVDLNLALASVEKMLRRTLAEDVDLKLELETRPLWITIDPTQIDQIVLNLSVNASDAMPVDGRLRLQASAVELAKPLISLYATVPPGRYARLSVVDNGHGISPDVMEHIFEPFFTTKEKGRGTGLGLATVFGIIKQAQGHIIVESEPGRGSVFRIYLPLVSEPAPSAEALEGASACASKKGERILLVEDQAEIRRLAERVLVAAGYAVLSCRNADEAFAAEAGYGGPIHLLVTDVVMPGMSGMELSVFLRVRRSGLRVLFMSGYLDDKVSHDGVLEPGVDLLQKPFTPERLLARVRAALDAKS